MYHFFEHWRARPPWLDLTVRERTAYLDRFGPEMESLADEGVALLGIVLKETRFLHRVECQYRGLWAVPAGLPHVRALNAMLERHGWDTYFDRYRARIEPVRMTAQSPTAASVKTGEVSVSVNGQG